MKSRNGLLTSLMLVLPLCLLSACCTRVHLSPGIVISGNENKVDLTTGAQKVLPNPEPDSLSVLNFSQFPPTLTNISNIPNTVVGPPSNIAISPDGTLALIANSIKADPASTTGWSPENYVHVLDLAVTPPKIVGRVTTGLQPSGISFTPNGKFALVANRAGGTISILAINKTQVTLAQTIKICEPAENLSDVAISPDGKFALTSVQNLGYLALLRIDDAGKVTLDPHRISTYGQPYRVVITSDGAFALTAGKGFGNGLDLDAVTVIDLKSPQPRTIDYVPVGSVPESLEVSPDGKLAAVVVMDGSNLDAASPLHSNAGAVVLLECRGNTFIKKQRVPVGRIPEGVAFTMDGKYLLVQCHPDHNIWIFRVSHDGLVDTGQRISVPGMPSSLRAGK